jgi:hypothetical protein
MRNIEATVSAKNSPVSLHQIRLIDCDISNKGGREILNAIFEFTFKRSMLIRKNPWIS